MTDQPQFRTVLRGLDPDQVASAMKELQTSLVVARRTAADRTVDLATAQQEVQRLRSQLDAAQARASELEQAPAAAAAGFGDLGARIGSMLSLAEEEASQMRASATAEARQVREAADADAMRMQSAAQASADEIVQRATEDASTRKAQAENLYAERNTLLSTAEADLDRNLSERRRKAEADLADDLARHEAQLHELRSQADQVGAHLEASHAQARDDARQIVEEAHAQAEQIRRDVEGQLAEAYANRDRIHAHLGDVHQVLVGLIAAGQVPLVSDPAATPDARAVPPVATQEGAEEGPEDSDDSDDSAGEAEDQGHSDANGSANGEDHGQQPWAAPSHPGGDGDETDGSSERIPWFREKAGSPRH